MNSRSSIALIVPSQPEQLDLVQAAAEQVARLAGCTVEPQLDFALAVREGAVNAMKHAHKFDPSRLVRLEFRCSPEFVEAAIVDHGPGFDVAAVPDPRAPENLMRPFGRGLLLISCLVDHVTFVHHETGMEVILRKLLDGAEAPLEARG